MRFFALHVALVAACLACSPVVPGINVEWSENVELNAALPAGMQVFDGVEYNLPLRAWALTVAPGAATIRIVQSADTADNRETVAEFAAREGACAAINGGYFSMAVTPAVHAGLLVEDGRMRSAATRNVTRDSVSYPAVRAALGFDAEGRPDVEWVTSDADTVFAWRQAPTHRPGEPAALPIVDHREIWDVSHALSAGPLLVRDGRPFISVNGEVFFGSSIPDIHPRTAAGYREDGTLVFVVVDGRQPQSRGVDLQELAAIMLQMDVVEALNLDGGGSSTMIVNDRLLNRPGGGTLLREVMSAIVINCG